ncbi:MAG TPA: hypothetical protein VG722_01820 [Tepidisphaeraceae bacterium]|nr:hypothetical protein [Tepidisphaeraceae bacterium]
MSLALALAGCAASQPATKVITAPPALSDVVLDSRPAAALVFSPPVTLGMPQLNLSREGREPEAFWGYSQGVTDFYDVQLDDRQYTDPSTGAYRESFSERAGMSFR